MPAGGVVSEVLAWARALDDAAGGPAAGVVGHCWPLVPCWQSCLRIQLKGFPCAITPSQSHGFCPGLGVTEHAALTPPQAPPPECGCAMGILCPHRGSSGLPFWQAQAGGGVLVFQGCLFAVSRVLPGIGWHPIPDSPPRVRILSSRGFHALPFVQWAALPWETEAHRGMSTRGGSTFSPSLTAS